jgi:hypothetical protein
MAAHYILGCLAVVFLVAAAAKSIREGKLGPAARTWLTIGVIFALVSVWSWLSTRR